MLVGARSNRGFLQHAKNYFLIKKHSLKEGWVHFLKLISLFFFLPVLFADVGRFPFSRQEMSMHLKNQNKTDNPLLFPLDILPSNASYYILYRILKGKSKHIGQDFVILVFGAGDKTSDLFNKLLSLNEMSGKTFYLCIFITFIC